MTKTFHFPSLSSKMAPMMAHYLIGWAKGATNEKNFRFISLVHHLSHLNHKHSTNFSLLGPQFCA